MTNFRLKIPYITYKGKEYSKWTLASMVKKKYPDKFPKYNPYTNIKGARSFVYHMFLMLPIPMEGEIGSDDGSAWGWNYHPIGYMEKKKDGRITWESAQTGVVHILNMDGSLGKIIARNL